MHKNIPHIARKIVVGRGGKRVIIAFARIVGILYDIHRPQVKGGISE
jgi:hypothetical protein